MPTFPIPVFVAAVLCFASLRLWQLSKGISPLGMLLIVCAVQSLIIALAQHYMIPGARFVQPVTAAIIPPAAWLAFQTVAVRKLNRADVLHGLTPVMAIAALAVAPRFLDVYLPGLFVTYGALILIQSLQGPDAQPRAFFSSGDIPSKIWLVIGAALILSAFSDGLIIAAQILGYAELRPWIISLFSVGNLLVIGMLSLSSHLQTDTVEDAPLPYAGAQPDAALMERITVYMAERKPFLDPDLTLTKLSRKLGAPAKMISTTINATTDENVSRFINNARIKTAQDHLMKGESITNAMLSSGFNTKSNFNREFLRVAEASPTDWLTKQQT